jgi:hypothetical protein
MSKDNHNWNRTPKWFRGMFDLCSGGLPSKTSSTNWWKSLHVGCEHECITDGHPLVQRYCDHHLINPDIRELCLFTSIPAYTILFAAHIGHPFPISRCFLSCLHCRGYKLRLSEQWDFTLKFPDPRPFIQKHGLAPTPFPVPLMGKDWGVERAELDIQGTERWFIYWNPK